MIDMNNPHYDENYYKWQKKAGISEAEIDIWKYDIYVKDYYTVLDYGCGGGFMLDKLKCKNKYGIEINEFAIQECKNKGIKVYKKIDLIPKDIKFDLILLNHALEHVDYPLKEIIDLRKYLKPQSGKIIFYTPFDSIKIGKKYTQNDVNKHLHTWSPLLLGNLFTRGGYRVLSVDTITHAWIPKSKVIHKYLPKPIFNFLCKTWSHIISLKQIRIIATTE